MYSGKVRSWAFRLNKYNLVIMDPLHTTNVGLPLYFLNLIIAQNRNPTLYIRLELDVFDPKLNHLSKGRTHPILILNLNNVTAQVNSEWHYEIGVSNNPINFEWEKMQYLVVVTIQSGGVVIIKVAI